MRLLLGSLKIGCFMSLVFRGVYGLSQMPVRFDFNRPCRDSSVSQFSAHIESPADDSFTRYSGLPGLRLVRVLDPKELAFGRLARFDARTGCSGSDKPGVNNHRGYFKLASRQSLISEIETAKKTPGQSQGSFAFAPTAFAAAHLDGQSPGSPATGPRRRDG